MIVKGESFVSTFLSEAAQNKYLVEGVWAIALLAFSDCRKE